MFFRVQNAPRYLPTIKYSKTYMNLKNNVIFTQGKSKLKKTRLKIKNKKKKISLLISPRKTILRAIPNKVNTPW